MRSFQYAVVLAIAVPSFAVSYVVPTDRETIQRAGTIITGRVLSETTSNSAQFGIETVTQILVEESLAGNAGAIVAIHEPGGIADGDVRLVPGVPSFRPGEHVLLFLYRREGGDFTVCDLQLGAFRFVEAEGNEVITRTGLAESRDPDGAMHRELARSPERFLQFVRSVVHHTAAEADYIGIPSSVSPPIASEAVYTASSYTVSLINGNGARWNIFPTTVNWNRGNSEIGPLGNGDAQITNAFNVWNAGGAHYALASSNANLNGIFDAADGINNVVFEKNLTSAGIQPYSCTQGGVLGVGGIHNVNGSHTFNGETFATTKEGDVSMNQGLGTCSLAQFPVEMFYTTVAHEVGHTLGFRHSDQTRTQNASCAGDLTLDCSNSAVMEHLIIAGLNGKLQAWDAAAVNHLYGAVCTPPTITIQPSGSAITAGSAAQLSVTASGTAPLTYQWFIGATGDTSSPAGAAATISVSPAATTSYWVRVSGACGPPADSITALITVSAANCPSVVLGTPIATPVSNGFQLSIAASGGSAFTRIWFQGAVQVGTGNNLVVNPAAKTSYWCRVTNNCGNTADSAIVTVTPAVCTAPIITTQPRDQQVKAESTVTLTVSFSGEAEVVWFEGAKGDTSKSIGTGSPIESPPLRQTTHFWAQLTNSCGSASSEAATITVMPARRRASVP